MLLREPECRDQRKGAQETAPAMQQEDLLEPQNFYIKLGVAVHTNNPRAGCKQGRGR